MGGGYSTSTNFHVQDTLGEVGTGTSTSNTFRLKAGYQQMIPSTISLTSVSDVVMSPAIAGITGGTANGSGNFTVTTDNLAGYSVTITASSSPAMQAPSGSFADYAPSGANPDFSFSVLPAESAFGFTVEGTDIAQKFKDDGASCNTGSGDTPDKCWTGLSTSAQTIVSRTSASISGSQTTVKFRIQSGSSHFQAVGTYTATTTITALTL